MQSAETTEQVYSNLADDPDLADQVEQFVNNLPRMLATLQEYADKRDWQTLGKVARQLKGSSACYGFDEISSQAGGLEEACRPPQGEREVFGALAELAQLCHCARSSPRPK